VYRATGPKRVHWFDNGYTCVVLSYSGASMTVNYHGSENLWNNSADSYSETCDSGTVTYYNPYRPQPQEYKDYLEKIKQGTGLADLYFERSNAPATVSQPSSSAASSKPSPPPPQSKDGGWCVIIGVFGGIAIFFILTLVITLIAINAAGN